jgi:predicted lipid-binding transport protein (Tim44 family)
MAVDIIIFAIVAIIIAYRFYNMIGKIDQEDLAKNDMANVQKDLDNIVKLKEDEYKEVEEESREEQRIIEALDDKSESSVSILKQRLPNFKLEKFISNSEKAFEMIISSFLSGDEKSLDKLATAEISKKFIDEKEKFAKQGQKLDIEVVAMISAIITNVSIKGNKALIALDFVSEQITSLKDKQGKIISGDEKRIEEIEDKWVFEKDLNDKSPIWLLAKT